MGRHKEAPFNFECPYKDHCPHLGMSTTWALTQIKHADQDRDFIHLQQEHLNALEKKSRADDREIAELRAQLKARHSSKFKPNTKAKKQKRVYPDQEPDHPARSRGAPRGHPPWNRAVPEHIDRTVHVPPPRVCPHCKTTGLAPSGTTQSHMQEDIILRPQTVVTEFVHALAYCPNCRRDIFATGEGELRNCEIGPTAKAAAVHLRHTVKLSYRDTQRVLHDLFGMSFVPASAMAFDRTVTAQGRGLYEELRETVQAADIIHGDETHWRIDGKSAYLWYAGNRDVAFFHVDRSRASQVAVSIFGDDFQGALCADAYSAYNAINSPLRQSCLAHLTRKAKDMIAEIMLMPKRFRDEKALAFLHAVRTMIAHACTIGAKRNSGRLSQKKALRYIPRFQNLLDTICLRTLDYQQAEKFRLRLIDPEREYNRMFTFLKVPGMEPTNNHAEQALRLPVIFRKICFGNRSSEGAESMGVILSLTTTAELQKQDPLAFMQTLLTRGPEQARELLFTGLPPP